MEGVKVSYFICGSQRTGTSVLCEALTLSGLAGRPAEHFVPEFKDSEAIGHDRAGFERSDWARRKGVESFPAFFEAVLEEGTTPNGVFGTKLMWNCLDGLLEKLVELDGCCELEKMARFKAAFPQPRFIYLRRRNRIRQSVSWALAAQTGHYAAWQAFSRPAFSEPVFDTQLLDGLNRLILEAEVVWRSFFENIAADPLELWFEDLADDLEAVLRQVLEWLGVQTGGRLLPDRLRHQPQATELNSEWEERYRALRPKA
jgi:LPS sulfotransferase NodH